MVTAAMKLKDSYSVEEKLWQPRQHIKKQGQYFAKKVRLVKAMVFPVVMYGCETWEGKEFLSNYRSGLYGYTYLE